MKTKLLRFVSVFALSALLSAFSSSSASAADAPTKVVAGSKVVLTVTADGTAPFTYTWQKAPAGSTTFATIAGQSGAVYTIASATTADAGNYRVIVANDYGTTTSTTASLNAGTAPNIINFGVVVTPPQPATP